MSNATIEVQVDVTNPGQFFACCGLLELADRLWPGAEGWFNKQRYCIQCQGRLADLLVAAQSTRYAAADDFGNDEEENDDEEEVVQPLIITSPMSIRLDWWADKSLKTWAGSMKVDRIAAAMSNAIDASTDDPMSQATVVFDASTEHNGKRRAASGKKREPFYFDSRRAVNSHSRDIGFSPNRLKMTTQAYPAVEYFCLIGLQRCRPIATKRPRVFQYWTWSWPSSVQSLPVAVCGLVRDSKAMCQQFENGFRSSQRKHKAFRPASPITRGAY